VLLAQIALVKPAARASHLKPLSILVADDVEEIRTLIQGCLTKAGHTVACAATGDRALTMLKERPFDLLITDVVMPDGDGLSVIIGIKNAKLPVRIIAISGGGKHVSSEYCVGTAESLGAHATLLKPFVPQTLFGVIEHAMGEQIEA
jgi:CheY-like chemotaxis protein